MVLELPQNAKPKSFWSKPEGTTGMLVGIPILALLGVGLLALLPFIISMLQNLITAVILGVAFVIIMMVVTSKRFWTLVWYLYKSAMRAITSLFITIDPIGILRNYVQSLKDNAGNMESQLSNLMGQMRKLKDTISQNEKQRVDALKMVDEANKQQKQVVMVLKSRKAGRLEESNMTLNNLYIKLEVLYRVLRKMQETCLVLIEDLSDEVDVKQREREAITASYSAFRSALKIINGDPDKKEMFDQTMQYLADDFGQKVGEIENFMEISKGVIDSIDLQNGIYEKDAMSKLEEWEKRGDSIILGNQKQLLIAQANDPKQVLNMQQEPEREPVLANRNKKDKGKYGTLFAKGGGDAQ